MCIVEAPNQASLMSKYDPNTWYQGYRLMKKVGEIYEPLIYRMYDKQGVRSMPLNTVLSSSNFGFFGGSTVGIEPDMNVGFNVFQTPYDLLQFLMDFCWYTKIEKFNLRMLLCHFRGVSKVGRVHDLPQSWALCVRQIILAHEYDTDRLYLVLERYKYAYGMNLERDEANAFIMKGWNSSCAL